MTPSSSAGRNKEEVRYDPATRRVRGRRVKRIGAIILEETPLPSPPKALIRQGLLEAVGENGLSILPFADDLAQLTARVELLHTNLGDPWPGRVPRHAGRPPRRLARPSSCRSASSLDFSIDAPAALHSATALLEWPLPRDLDVLAPAVWTAPVGRRVSIDYTAEGYQAPECKGSGSLRRIDSSERSPATALPLTLALLSPAQRPVAVTKTSPQFLEGRLPRHAQGYERAVIRSTNGQERSRRRQLQRAARSPGRDDRKTDAVNPSDYRLLGLFLHAFFSVRRETMFRGVRRSA